MAPDTAPVRYWMTPRRFFHITGACGAVTAILLYVIPGIFLDSASLSTGHQVCALVGDWSVTQQACSNINLATGLVGLLLIAALITSVAPFAWLLKRK